MATLEKIRKRSVLLLVIIGAALVAFIIGDFLNSGRNIFGDGTTVAKVDGEKIDYLAFQQRYSEFTEQTKRFSAGRCYSAEPSARNDDSGNALQ